MSPVDRVKFFINPNGKVWCAYRSRFRAKGHRRPRGRFPTPRLRTLDYIGCNVARFRQFELCDLFAPRYENILRSATAISAFRPTFICYPSHDMSRTVFLRKSLQRVAFGLLATCPPRRNPAPSLARRPSSKGTTILAEELLAAAGIEPGAHLTSAEFKAHAEQLNDTVSSKRSASPLKASALHTDAAASSIPSAWTCRSRRQKTSMPRSASASHSITASCGHRLHQRKHLPHIRRMLQTQGAQPP